MRNKTDGKEMPRNQKPNGTNAPKCDFPDLLDMRPCPTRTLQMELPFTGRTPQIGIKVPPKQARSKRPWCALQETYRIAGGCVARYQIPSFWSSKSSVFSERTSGPVWRRENEGVLKTKKAWAAARATSPLFSTAASGFCCQDGGRGVIKAQPYSRGTLTIWPQRNPPTFYSTGGSWCGEKSPSIQSSSVALRGRLPMIRSRTSLQVCGQNLGFLCIHVKQKHRNRVMVEK